jgi:protein required for attachment to host cells
MSSVIGILVCNHYRARIFSATPVSITSEIVDQVNPQARLRDQDLATDEPGKYRGGGPGGQHHTEDHRIPSRDKAAINFARDISAALDGAVVTQGFAKLYVVAEPAMLGLLRAELSERCRKLVADEITKDVVGQTPEQIRRYLPTPL